MFTPPRVGLWIFWAILCAIIVLCACAAPAWALEGDIRIHDPSTVIKCNDVYYVFGTGRGIPYLTSSNGFTWQRGGKLFDAIPDTVRSYVPKNNGAGIWAPDVIKLKDEYAVYYAVSAWGQFVSAVGLITSPTLDPKDPNYKWTDRGMIVHSSEGENLNAIDPGAVRGGDGTLWLCYGSYHGNIELVQLDPETGLRTDPKAKAWVIANRSEASDIIYHENYYYLFVNHGTCCSGTNSTYNIRVGRSEKVTGPYLDRYGNDLTHGGGSLFVGSGGKQIGPGHFGLLQDDGVEKFSCHFEADMDTHWRSAMDIRPLLWSDGWPVAGVNITDGTYQIRSQRTGLVLQTSNNAAPVAMGDYLLRDNQNGSYRIKADTGDFVLGTNPGMPHGNNVALLAPTADDSQKWRIEAP